MSTKLAWFFLILCLARRPLSSATLVAAAAADLSSANRDLTDAFHRAYPADWVRLVFASSGSIAQQIANGAPYDVFLSANENFVDQLAISNKIKPDSVRVYALGQLGLLWGDGKARPLADVREQWVRLVAIANPALAPYGAAAQQALEHEQLWDGIRSKLVFGENVRQTLQILDSGNADAVLTAYSLVMTRPGVAVIPADWHKPIRQKAGIVSASQNAEAATHFLAFLSGPSGAKVLEAHGLQPVRQ